MFTLCTFPTWSSPHPKETRTTIFPFKGIGSSDDSSNSLTEIMLPLLPRAVLRYLGGHVASLRGRSGDPVCRPSHRSKHLHVVITPTSGFITENGLNCSRELFGAGRATDRIAAPCPLWMAMLNKTIFWLQSDSKDTHDLECRLKARQQPLFIPKREAGQGSWAYAFPGGA